MSKLLQTALIALCLSAGAAQARTIFGFQDSIDLVKSMTWAEKVAFMKTLGGKFKKECRKPDGCAMVARKGSDDSNVILTLIETPATKYEAAHRQWCIKEVESWRLRCEDDK